MPPTAFVEMSDLIPLAPLTALAPCYLTMFGGWINLGFIRGRSTAVILKRGRNRRCECELS